jgi:phytoene dehydrogenase-like protein
MADAVVIGSGPNGLVAANVLADADPSRAPAGADVAWAYTHVPQHVKGDTPGPTG